MDAHHGYDDDLSELQNHEAVAQKFVDMNFPNCRLRKMAYSLGNGYAFGVYYSREQEVSEREKNGLSVPPANGSSTIGPDDADFELN